MSQFKPTPTRSSYASVINFKTRIVLAEDSLCFPSFEPVQWDSEESSSEHSSESDINYLGDLCDKLEGDFGSLFASSELGDYQIDKSQLKQIQIDQRFKNSDVVFEDNLVFNSKPIIHSEVNTELDNKMEDRISSQFETSSSATLVKEKESAAYESVLICFNGSQPLSQDILVVKGNDMCPSITITPTEESINTKPFRNSSLFTEDCDFNTASPLPPTSSPTKLNNTRSSPQLNSQPHPPLNRTQSFSLNRKKLSKTVVDRSKTRSSIVLLPPNHPLSLKYQREAAKPKWRQYINKLFR